MPAGETSAKLPSFSDPDTRIHQSFKSKPYAQHIQAHSKQAFGHARSGNFCRMMGAKVNSKPDIIMFLCPNGHRLNAPRRLQGQPGKCPHCNVRFRVPNVTDNGDNPLELATASTSASSASAMRNMNEIKEVSNSSDFGFHDDAGTSDVLQSSIGPKPVVAPPAQVETQRLYHEFCHLWNHRDAKSSLEIHLPEGEVFVPQHFSQEKSSAELGYFARQAESGKYQVHLIPWKSVCRVVAGGLADLPFEA